MIECPCIKCALQGCGAFHNTCVRYKAYKEELEEKNRIERLEKISCDVMSDAQKRHCWIKKRYSRNQPISRPSKDR